LTFTVIIPTFNREQLVLHAVASAIETRWPGLEIIVVDDASTDGTGAAIARQFPQVRYFRLARNRGPGVARNFGLHHATAAWSVLLDDDDTLRLDSLATIARSLEDWPRAQHFPCVQFARTNGSLAESFAVVDLPDYLRGRIRGDFVPVINVAEFLRLGLSYPHLGVGGEHLLWFRVAKTHGIPTWSHCVADVGLGTRVKLCSTASQLARPEEYGALAELSIAQFGDDMWAIAPLRYMKCALGAATYHLLAGNKRAAMMSNRKLRPVPRMLATFFTRTAGLFPAAFLRRAFRACRFGGG
jgi:glycosyltransferase involved in cell wall biosynthesis